MYKELVAVCICLTGKASWKLSKYTSGMCGQEREEDEIRNKRSATQTCDLLTICCGNALDGMH